MYGPVAQGDQVQLCPPDRREPNRIFLFRIPGFLPRPWFSPSRNGCLSSPLNPEDPEAHILKEKAEKENRRLLVGIRPCDARAYDLVQLNFVTPDYRGPLVETRPGASDPHGSGV